MVTAPSGAVTTVGFADDTSGLRNTGAYEGVFKPTEDGRHHAVVTVVGSPQSSIADPLGRLSHSLTGAVDADPGAPDFVRLVRMTFDVGRLPEPERQKPETPSGKGLLRPRPLRLVSAKRTRLFPA